MYRGSSEEFQRAQANKKQQKKTNAEQKAIEISQIQKDSFFNPLGSGMCKFLSVNLNKMRLPATGAFGVREYLQQTRLFYFTFVRGQMPFARCSAAATPAKCEYTTFITPRTRSSEHAAKANKSGDFAVNIQGL